MENITTYQSACSIYPGKYVPLLNEDTITEKVKSIKEEKVIHPQVYVTEYASSYKVKVNIPGIKQGEIMIHADDNVLNIYAVHGELKTLESDSFQLSKLEYDYFQQTIFLEKNIDSDFINASYNAGVLILYISKANQNTKQLHAKIVVY